MNKVEYWLKPEDANCLSTFNYWNNLEEERKKPWYVKNKSASIELNNYLEKKQYFKQFYDVEKFIKNQGSNLTVADLACGTGWTSSLISKIDQVIKIYSVEFSEHRLVELFPETIKILEGISNKIYPCFGSFYDCNIESSSVDIVFLSQAFHHADKPILLATECKRILKKGGKTILIGETTISDTYLFVRYLKNLIKNRKVIPTLSDLLPKDLMKGDNHFPSETYNFIWEGLDFKKIHRKDFSSGMSVYVFEKL